MFALKMKIFKLHSPGIFSLFSESIIVYMCILSFSHPFLEFQIYFLRKKDLAI